MKARIGDLLEPVLSTSLRRGTKKAVVALTASILNAASFIRSRHALDNDLGPGFLDPQNRLRNRLNASTIA